MGFAAQKSAAAQLPTPECGRLNLTGSVFYAHASDEVLVWPCALLMDCKVHGPENSGGWVARDHLELHQRG
jgi:hypothetical protein